jgi:ribose transport system permease protein
LSRIEEPLTSQPEPVDGVEDYVPSDVRRRSGWDPIGLLERNGLLLLLVAVLIVFSFMSKQFFTGTNLRITLGQQAVLAIVALASIVPLVGGQFDLSIATNVGAAGIVLATCMSRFKFSLGLAIVITLGWCVILGLVNGFFVARLGVNSFIVTLATSTVLEGLVEWYTNGNTISTRISSSLVNDSTGNLAGIPKGLLWLAPVVLLLWYMLEHTPYGRRLHSTGSNKSAAAIIGIPVARVVMVSFVICAVLGGVAAILLVGQSGDANPEVAQGTLLLPALAAAFLGSSAFRSGRFNVPGTVVAVYFVAFSVSGLELVGVTSWVEQVFDGAALAGAVTATTLLARKKRTA